MATYVLLITIPQNQPVTVGAKGVVDLIKGGYLYVGSARKNWQKRVARHCRKEKKKRWHIDYILDGEGGEVEEVWISQEDRECPTCQVLTSLAGTKIPRPGIGSSDCRCPAHFLELQKGFRPVQESLKKQGFEFFPHLSS